MQVSSFISAFKYPLLALGHLMMLVGIVWLISLLIAHQAFVFHLYREPLGAEGVEFWYAGKISRLLSSDKRTCLLIGPSGVRDGFEEHTMNAVEPSVSFLNGGVLGRIAIVEARVNLLRDYEIKPDCIVLGIFPFIVSGGMHDIMTRRHVDFLDYWRGWDLIQHEDVDKRGVVVRQAVANSVWPMKRFAYRINQLVRFRLFQLRELVTRSRTMRIELSPEISNPPDRVSRIMARRRVALEQWLDVRLERRRVQFEIGPGDLRTTRRHFRPDGEDPKARERFDAITASRIESLSRDRDRRREAPALSVAHLRQLGRTVDTALEITPHVAVVMLPWSDSHPAFWIHRRNVSPVLQYLEPYERDKGLLVIDKSQRLTDAFFHDFAHTNDEGRDLLSREVARELGAYMRRPLSVR